MAERAKRYAREAHRDDRFSGGFRKRPLPEGPTITAYPPPHYWEPPRVRAPGTAPPRPPPQSNLPKPKRQDDSVLRIFSSNVTTLTMDRLDVVCDAALKVAAQVILLQETRHWGDAAWIKNRAAQWGYRCHVSPPVGFDHRRVRNYGGTAILWKHEMGKSSATPSDSHRQCGRKWDGLEI